jgi:hypothetical protein
VSHATAVAYVALLMATGGTAVAATGGNFILGKSNSASTVSTLTNSEGTALSLRSPAGQPPLRVNRAVRVPSLNADLLDGRDSTGFLRLGTTNSSPQTVLTNPDGVPFRLNAKAGSAPLQVSNTVKVANLNADLLDGKDSTAFATAATVQALQARVAQLETLLAGVSREWVDGDTLRFSGMNVQIVNGTGTTDGATNGRGNLIIGYSAQRNPEVPRPGSHYLVIGDRHQWAEHSGIVAGLENTATGDLASVLGSQGSTASGAYASVTGGSHNTASAEGASVSGGTFNTASGLYSSVLGGNSKTVTLSHACHPSCV